MEPCSEDCDGQKSPTGKCFESTILGLGGSIGSWQHRKCLTQCASPHSHFSNSAGLAIWPKYPNERVKKSTAMPSAIAPRPARTARAQSPANWNPSKSNFLFAQACGGWPSPPGTLYQELKPARHHAAIAFCCAENRPPHRKLGKELWMPSF